MYSITQWYFLATSKPLIECQIYSQEGIQFDHLSISPSYLQGKDVNLASVFDTR